MAFLAGSTTDDGNSGAPIDFQISSSSSESDCGQYEIRSMYEREKCPLCFKLKKRFICKECLGRGDFWSSTGDIRERFHELKSQLQEKKEEREQIIRQCLVLTEPRDRILVIIEEMDKYHRTIQIQKQLKNEMEKRVAQAKQECEYIKKQVNEKERIWPLYRSRLNNMEQQRAKRMVELKKKANYVVERRKHLQNIPWILNEKLQSSNMTLISSNDSWSDEEDDTVRSLMAAPKYDFSVLKSNAMDSDSFLRSRNNSTSMAGNLVQSVTSFFRGWNG